MMRAAASVAAVRASSMLVKLLGDVKVADSCMAAVANARLRHHEILPPHALGRKGISHFRADHVLVLVSDAFMSLRLWTGFEDVILVSLASIDGMLVRSMRL